MHEQLLSVNVFIHFAFRYKWMTFFYVYIFMKKVNLCVPTGGTPTNIKKGLGKEGILYPYNLSKSTWLEKSYGAVLENIVFL